MDRVFFARDTRTVARELLGMEIVRKQGDAVIRGYITETEAYRGWSDKASHASRGKTLRNAPMFGPPGTLYVYLIYGMYWCINIVTEREGYPAAVLIRGISILPDGPRIDGPGRTARALSIDRSFNERDLLSDKEFFINGRFCAPRPILRTPRIGVAYAQEWASKPWRFLVQ